MIVLRDKKCQTCPNRPCDRPSDVDTFHHRGCWGCGVARAAEFPHKSFTSSYVVFDRVEEVAKGYGVSVTDNGEFVRDREFTEYVDERGTRIAVAWPGPERR